MPGRGEDPVGIGGLVGHLRAEENILTRETGERLRALCLNAVGVVILTRGQNRDRFVSGEVRLALGRRMNGEKPDRHAVGIRAVRLRNEFDRTGRVQMHEGIRPRARHFNAARIAARARQVDGTGLRVDADVAVLRERAASRRTFGHGQDAVPVFVRTFRRDPDHTEVRTRLRSECRVVSRKTCGRIQGDVAAGVQLDERAVLRAKPVDVVHHTVSGVSRHGRLVGEDVPGGGKRNDASFPLRIGDGRIHAARGGSTFFNREDDGTQLGVKRNRARGMRRPGIEAENASALTRAFENDVFVRGEGNVGVLLCGNAVDLPVSVARNIENNRVGEHLDGAALHLEAVGGGPALGRHREGTRIEKKVA